MWKYIFGLLILANFSIWYFVATYPDDNVHIIACDVGQGDGFLIFQKTTQILVDGGPGNKMVSCLDRYLPVWDRTIELVINTHPQLDHYEGLIGVFQKYDVQKLTANSLKADAQQYRVLKDLVGSRGVTVINPKDSIRIVSNLMSIDIIHPSPQFLAENLDNYGDRKIPVLNEYGSSLDPNEFSIVFNFHYGKFDALFTGDINENVIKLLEGKGILNDIEYLKVPHHGSKNGLTEGLLNATTPEIAVISVGKNNSYGNPGKEVLNMLKEKQITTYRTDEKGDIEVETDGENFWVKN